MLTSARNTDLKCGEIYTHRQLGFTEMKALKRPVKEREQEKGIDRESEEEKGKRREPLRLTRGSTPWILGNLHIRWC